jgi:hypothetical protein
MGTQQHSDSLGMQHASLLPQKETLQGSVLASNRPHVIFPKQDFT